MEITYTKIDEKTVKAVGEYTNRCYPIPGVPSFIFYTIVYDFANAKDKNILLNFEDLTSYAHCSPQDEFDWEKGKTIARNRLIIKDAERQLLKQIIVDKYLGEVQEVLSKFNVKYIKRLTDSYDRLDELCGEGEL